MPARHFAKVGVEGSNPFARSSFQNDWSVPHRFGASAGALQDLPDAADQGERFRLCADEDGVRDAGAQSPLCTLIYPDFALVRLASIDAQNPGLWIKIAIAMPTLIDSALPITLTTVLSAASSR
jgi:hypothetical protein